MKSDLFHDVARAYYGISPELHALSQKYAAKSMPGQTNLFDKSEGNAAEAEEGKAAASPKKTDSKRSSKKTDSKTVNPNFPPPKKQPKSSPGQMEMFQEPDQYAGEDEAGQTPSRRSLYRQHLASAGAKEVEPGVFELPRNRGREFRQKMAKLNLWPDQQFGTKQGNWKFVLYQDNEGDDNSPYALGDAQVTGTGEPAPYAIPDAKAKAKRWKRPRGKKGKLPEKNCATACK